MPLISSPPPSAGPRVTSALTSIDSAVRFSDSSTPDRFIARHDECAAAMSSFGLVRPSGLPARVGKDTSNWPALDESSVTWPEPLCRPPSQWVVASRLGMVFPFRRDRDSATVVSDVGSSHRDQDRTGP